MLEHEFEESLGFWVFTAAHSIETAMNEELAAVGITFRQCQILACLAIHGEVVQNELADHLRVEPSSIVRILDRMERDGWIVRESDPDDRRRKIVRPTPQVEPIWRTIRTQGMSVKQRALEGIPEEAIPVVLNALRRLSENLSRDGSLPMNYSKVLGTPVTTEK
ncbi:MarR family winged helix-turn-helix transcriptional regulator [Calycomorphotria hydatis]|uniref:Transcriptional regulator SlyA n=1 Tax=Calycomorphotria hydatis TaxID=2528027 RepID=A0A517T7U9_9PLAN|nr:MarR family transcriptional regulator [Calycomorphotria hydatis]QDT64449.1 Transcriptional regulator SlyA [Calycomorphotria hydatis]